MFHTFKLFKVTFLYLFKCIKHTVAFVPDKVDRCWYSWAEQFDKLKIIEWGFIVVFNLSAALNVKLHIVRVIGKREVLHLECKINYFVVIARYKTNVVLNIGAESIFDLWEEITDCGVGWYLDFENARPVLINGKGDDVRVLLNGGFAIHVDREGWFGEGIGSLFHSVSLKYKIRIFLIIVLQFDLFNKRMEFWTDPELLINCNFMHLKIQKSKKMEIELFFFLYQ